MSNYMSFYIKHTTSKTKGLIISVIILSFITSAVLLVDFLFGDLIAIVSVVFYFFAAFTLLFYKNWMLPLVIVIYSLIFSFMIFDGISFVMGLLNMVLGILATIKVRKINAAFERYRKSNEESNDLI